MYTIYIYMYVCKYNVYTCVGISLYQITCCQSCSDIKQISGTTPPPGPIFGYVQVGVTQVMTTPLSVSLVHILQSSLSENYLN